MINSNWPDFAYKAHAILRQSEPVNTFQPYVHLLCEPSLGNPFTFQLSWGDSSVRWFSNEWLKIDDGLKFDPIENLKFIGIDLQPTIRRKEGELSTVECAGIIDIVQNLSVKPCISYLNRMMIDGSSYTLATCSTALS